MLSETQKAEIHERAQLIADVLEAREPPKAQSSWTITYVVPALIAIVTAAATTLATFYGQAALKAKEYDLTRKDVGLTQTRDAMTSAYDLFAALLKGSQDRLKIATGQYDALPQSAIVSIVNETNAIDTRWRRDRETTEASVYLYYGDNPSTVEQWKATRLSMQSYADCALNEYVAAQQRRTSAPPEACDDKRRAAIDDFARLRDAMIADYRRKLAS